MRNKVLNLIACSKVSWDFLRYVVNSRESNVCSESFAFSQYLDVPFMFGIKLRRASANRVLLYCPLPSISPPQSLPFCMYLNKIKQESKYIHSYFLSFAHNRSNITFSSSSRS